MKYTLACLLIGICFTALCQDTYYTTWKTDNEGSSRNKTLNTARPFITTWQTDSLNQVTYPIDASESDTSFIIDWGDGSVDTVTRGTYIHTYDVSDIYTVSVWGNLDNPSLREQENLLTVEQWGDSKWKSMNRAFLSCGNLRVPATDAPDLSNVTSITGIFAGATSFDDPLGHWDVSNVEHFHGVFLGASSFNQPLNDWDLGNAISLDQMFDGAISFNQPLDLWDVSNVRQMSWIFENAISFDQNIGSWNIKNVNNTTNFLENSGLSRENYDSTIIGWSKLDSLPVGLRVEADGLFYCSSQEARDSLVSRFSWSFFDEGQLCDDLNDFSLNNNVVRQGYPIGTVIGRFSHNGDQTDIDYQFVLIDSVDSKFQISDGRLMTKDSFEEVEDEYIIKVVAKINNLESLEKEFIIIGEATNVTNADRNIPEISVFPNPTTGVVNFKLDQLQTGSSRALVYDISGHLILEKDFTDQLDISSLARGNYLIKIGSDVFRIVKY